MMKTTSSMFALAALAGALPAQQLNLPDNHHLCENVTQLGSTGSGLWWQTVGGRFQILYEASHFLGKGGVLGPVVITRIKFRHEDAEINLGGQVYTGVTVELGSTSLGIATMDPTTFATNRTPALPNTTTMGALGTTTVTLAPSIGSLPNNWNIDIDLAAIGATIIFDPTSAEPNLLIDISMPTAPANAPPLALGLMQNTTGTPAIIRGAGITSAVPGSLTGTFNPNPLIVGLEFAGAGGYPTLIPARNEFYGAACGGSPSSFYQAFLNGQTFDLGGGLTLTPNNAATPTIYTVTAGAPAPDVTQTNAVPDVTADDGFISFPLGFTFNYPGGSTTTIVPSSNGFVWLDPTMFATAANTAFAPVVSRLLGDGVVAGTYSGARLAVFWKDLNMVRNIGLNPIAGLHVKTDITGGPGANVCYVTWWNVGEFNTVSGVGVFGHTNWTFQCVMYEATGVVQYRYGPIMAIAGASTTTVGSNAIIVGFSQGRIGGLAGINSVDPQSRDLSLEIPFATKVEGAAGNMGQTAIATPNAGGVQYGGRMYGGQTMTWNATNVPVGSVIGAQLLDVGSTRPGLMFPTITAPGCMLSTTTGATIWQIALLPPSTFAGTVPFVVPHGFQGVEIYAQFVVLDGLLGGPNLITVASNALKHTVGLN